MSSTRLICSDSGGASFFILTNGQGTADTSLTKVALAIALCRPFLAIADDTSSNTSIFSMQILTQITDLLHFFTKLLNLLSCEKSAKQGHAFSSWMLLECWWLFQQQTLDFSNCFLKIRTLLKNDSHSAGGSHNTFFLKNHSAFILERHNSVVDCFLQ